MEFFTQRGGVFKPGKMEGANEIFYFIYYRSPNGKRVLTNTNQIVSYEHVKGNKYIIYLKQERKAKYLARDISGEVIGDDIVKVEAEIDPRTIKHLPKDKEGVKIEKKEIAEKI